MSQGVKASATMADDLSVIPRIHNTEESNSRRLSSDPLMCTMVSSAPSDSTPPKSIGKGLCKNTCFLLISVLL